MQFKVGGIGTVITDIREIEAAFDDICGRLGSVLDESGGASGVIESILVGIGGLRSRFRMCMELNDACLAAFHDPFDYDPETETFYGLVDGERKPLLKVNRADPNVPITVVGSQKMAAFVPRAVVPNPLSTGEGDEAQRKLGDELQAFYYAASKLWDRIEQELLGKKGSKFIGVKLVRNRLFEHAVRGEQNSFGVSGNVGPTVKPMRYTKSKDEAPYDAGLLPNVEEFLRYCLERIGKP